jgi:hypothetical protein
MNNKLTLNLLLAFGAIALTACNSGSSNGSTVAQNQALQLSANGLTGSTCDGIATWDANTAYATAGTKVVQNGIEYSNNWWTKGDSPANNSGASGSGKPWTIITNCGVAPTPTPTPTVSPTATPNPTPTVTPTPTPDNESSGLPAIIKFTGKSTASGDLYFHLNLPMGSGNVEKISLSNNYTDLIISNYVSGAVLGDMMREKYPSVHFNRDYVYGTAFAQLLQENINTSTYVSSSEYINTQAERKTLLSAGQGGPYQLNDYSKRLEGTSGLGLINYVAIQKGLGFTVEAQDDNSQTSKKGPISLDQKYFGPLAAVYFHFNDINRLAVNNAETYGPQYKYYSQCMSNLAKAPTGDDVHNMYDMILNAAYNAGTYSIIIGDYYRVCAGMYGTGVEATQINSLGDYSLSDTQYQQKIGTKEAVGGTFILYPRQIRIYLDQMYNKETFKSNAFNGNVKIDLSVADTKAVFTNVMLDVAYQHGGEYSYVSQADAEKAFDEAMTKAGVNSNTMLSLANSAEREKFFNLLDSAVANLSANLKFSFAAVTQTTIGGTTPTPTPTTTPTPGGNCPTTAPVYPAGRNSYVSGTIVKASDSQFYKCNPGVAAWCNSTAEWAYAPATGAATTSAWTLQSCK